MLKKEEGTDMTINEKKAVCFTILIFMFVILLVGGSMLITFNLYDLIYLMIIVFFMGRYIYIKVKG